MHCNIQSFQRHKSNLLWVTSWSVEQKSEAAISIPERVKTPLGKVIEITSFHLGESSTVVACPAERASKPHLFTLHSPNAPSAGHKEDQRVLLTQTERWARGHHRSLGLFTELLGWQGVELEIQVLTGEGCLLCIGR